MSSNVNDAPSVRIALLLESMPDIEYEVMWAPVKLHVKSVSPFASSAISWISFALSGVAPFSLTSLNAS
jgi:hypothetical protein